MKKQLRIGIDGRYAENDGGGINRYIHEIIKYIVEKGDTPVVFSTRRIPNTLPGVEYRVVPQVFHWFIWEQFQLPFFLHQSKLDLYHAAGNWGIPFFTRVPSVLTIHDVIPLVAKDFFAKSPFPRISKLLYSLRVGSSLKLAKKVIATTDISDADLKKFFKFESSEIIPMGVGKDFFSAKKLQDKEILKKYKVPMFYILNFGGIDQRKNIDRLLEAYSMYIKKQAGAPSLVITGGTVSQRKSYRKTLHPHVIFTGWVSEDDLPILVRNAAFVVYPALIEGFGLPLLETMASRTPVVASRLDVFEKIAKNVPIYIDPLNRESILRGMIEAASGSRKDMLDQGVRIAKKLSWANTMEKTYRLYSEI